MKERPYDPNSLADELDRVLPPGQAGQAASSNDPLVETAARLSAAPRPTLSPEALARIHATMLAGQNAAPAASRSLTRRFLRQSVPVRLAVASVLLFVFVTSAIFAAQIGVRLIHPPRSTSLPLITASLPPTLTSTIVGPDTVTPISPSPTLQIILPETPSLTPTIQPTTLVPKMVPTAAIPIAASPTAAPTGTIEASTPGLTLMVTIVIEGPIQAINGNRVMIFGLTTIVNPSDPILTTLHIGDVVRIEGYYAADEQMIIAVHITVLRNTAVPNLGVEVNPPTGQVWTDPGNCSNPPPPWAPAIGWRRRCQGEANPGNSGGNGMGMGNG